MGLESLSQVRCFAGLRMTAVAMSFCVRLDDPLAGKGVKRGIFVDRVPGIGVWLGLYLIVLCFVDAASYWYFEDYNSFRCGVAVIGVVDGIGGVQETGGVLRTAFFVEVGYRWKF